MKPTAVSPGAVPGPSAWRGEQVLVCALVLAKLLLHLVAVRDYGYFRDEFYYIKLGERVFDGPIGMPLLAPLLMALNLSVLGDSLAAIRLWPALAGAGVVALTVFLVRGLGGRLFAQALAGVCVLLAPVYLGANSTFSYDSLDELFWVLAFSVLVRLLKQDQPRLWLWFGLVAGLGLLAKESMLFLGFGVAAGFLLTPQRRYYRTKWMWLGAGIAFLFLTPYLVMQAKLGWPTLGYWGFYTQRKTYPVTPWEFLLFQVMVMNPVTLPVWLSGLYFALRAEAGRPWRALGWTYLILFGLFTVLRAKFYFLSPAYAFLLAAGAVQLEGVVFRRRIYRAAYAYLAAIIASGAALAPFALPLLPVKLFLRVAAVTSGDLGVKQERLATPSLPQHFADRFGWENMAAQVTRVYHGLSAEERAKVCIFAGNYGEAGAIEFFGRRQDPHFPPVLSGHGQYFFWGPRSCGGEVMVIVGAPRAELERGFQSVVEAGRIQSDYAMPYENNLPIYLCRNPRQPLKEVWPRLGRFN